jgi:cobalt-zinc-cadmium efflux system membrane fusion protein
MTEFNDMRPRSGSVWIALMGVAILALLVTLYRNQAVELDVEEEVVETASNGTVTFLMEQQWLIGMKLAQAQRRELSPQVRAVGRVIPADNYSAIISSPVTGLVQDANRPVLGQQVRPGEDVLAIEQLPQVADAAQAAQLRLEVIRTQSERRRLEQSGAEAEIRLRQAEREWTRARRLHEEELMALQEVEAAETEYDAAESVVASYVEQLAALVEAPNLDNAMRTTTRRQVLSAPIGGRVNQIFKEVGELVQPGEPVLDIVNLDVVWVEAPIFEKDLAAVLDTGEVIFETIAYPGVEFVGELVDVSARIDEETRTAAVIFAIQNRDGRLRIGMQANIRLATGPPRALVSIAAEAVLEHEGRNIVYVLLSGEEFERRNVVLGDRYGDEVSILSGVESGERVVTQGAYQLKLQELQPADPGAHTHEV